MLSNPGRSDQKLWPAENSDSNPDANPDTAADYLHTGCSTDSDSTTTSAQNTNPVTKATKSDAAC